MPTVHDQLALLFDKERDIRALHASLLEHGRAELITEITSATKSALALANHAEAALRLARLSLVLGDLDGDTVVDLLVDILGSHLPEPRVSAGEALEVLAFDRFKEVALGIERALDRLPASSPALVELPFLLAEVAEPGCMKLLGRFLKHANADVVGAAIEALAELGDPAAIPLLAPLENDGRQVQLDDDSGHGDRVTIGDLVFEARELLAQIQDRP
ncbi:MAG: HEAT repeat domain-containing protein [Polyangiaceae bacterium]|nr:HEAT repeat domain-containing protein [Polyangiaceae bacterium]